MPCSATSILCCGCGASQKPCTACTHSAPSVKSPRDASRSAEHPLLLCQVKQPSERVVSLAGQWSLGACRTGGCQLQLRGQHGQLLC